MPYRHAHYWLLLLFPLTGLAFWPNYFSVFATSPYAFHVHGVTASLWILMLAFQSWSIHSRQNALHRTAGLSVLILLPLFTVGGVLVLQTMAVKFAASTDPLFVTFGARLGALDFISTLAIPVLVYLALKWRRKVHLHARYLLVTVFFLIPPILSRLLPALPPLAIEGPQHFHRFGYGVHIAIGMTILLAAFLYARAPKHGRPFLIVGSLCALQMLIFETAARTAWWEGLFAALASVPAPLLIGLGLAGGALAAWLGWAADARREARPATA
jgi:hypothetical protein